MSDKFKSLQFGITRGVCALRSLHAFVITNCPAGLPSYLSGHGSMREAAPGALVIGRGMQRAAKASSLSCRCGQGRPRHNIQCGLA